MKFYINKQTPKQTASLPSKDNVISVNNNPETTEVKEVKTDEETVVFPPDIDLSLYKEKGIAVENYSGDICKAVDYGEGIGGAISQRGGHRKQLVENAIDKGYIEECSYLSRTQDRKFFPHDMVGRFNFISIPQSISEPPVVASMISLVNKYKGKYVCLDLWNNENIRVEKCGYLEDADEGYILVKGEDEVTMINLNTVKYINIYCR